MYQDRNSRKKGWIILAACLCVLVFCCVFFAGTRSAGDMDEETAVAIKDAVRRSALQCYVVEGIYPPDLAYLQDNYGLQVNTSDYYVVYEAFASNVPPTINVLRK